MTNEWTTTIPTSNGGEMSATWVETTTDRRGSVVLFMDGFGPRPALLGNAQRMVEWGYDVLIPNLYYREEGVLPINVEAVFEQGEYAQQFFARLEGMKEAWVVEDVEAIAEYLRSARHTDGVLAAVGYCLGGRYALSFAGVASECDFAASIHGANLATDSDDSAHLLAARGNADIHLSVAQIDPTFSMEQLDKVRDVLVEAGKHLVIEIHPGAVHGFSLSDLPVYNADAADAHWGALARFLRRG